MACQTGECSFTCPTKAAMEIHRCDNDHCPESISISGLGSHANVAVGKVKTLLTLLKTAPHSIKSTEEIPFPLPH